MYKKMKKKNYKLALIGNPNCGKTTVFNLLTSSKKHVGNWSGVTVEQTCETMKIGNKKIEVVDLPGIYSLSAFSLDEKITRNFLFSEDYNFIVNIVDGNNLERSLYLTIQMIEMKIPMIIILNKMDLIRKNRFKIDVKHLSAHLDIPVVPMAAIKRNEFPFLKEQLEIALDGVPISKTKIYYDKIVEEQIDILIPELSGYLKGSKIDPRWLVIKLMEDEDITHINYNSEFENNLKKAMKKIEKHIGDDTDIILADGRYGFINGLIKDVLKGNKNFRRTVSDKIDKVVLNKVSGIPIFLLILYSIFSLTISVSQPFITFFQQIFEIIFIDGFFLILDSLHFSPFLTEIFVEGFGRGIVVVSTFIPPIFFIFLCLSILEDSGYISRAAFIADKVMRVAGLPGKSFIPMLIGFGCTVPAIMATRTLDSKRDRYLTVLMTPFISCGAKLPVYFLFVSIFFPENSGLIIFSLYLVGIILSFLTGIFLKRTMLEDEGGMFVMELPPYHIPTITGIFYHTWDRLKSFVVRAGKIIIGIIIILNILGKIDFHQIEKPFKKSIVVLFAPMGIERENWSAVAALFSGLLAKEAIVGTLNSLHSELKIKEKILPQSIPKKVKKTFNYFLTNIFSKDKTDIKDVNNNKRIRDSFKSKAAAYAYLIFILIYAPCFATIVTIYKETSLIWAIFSTIFLTLLGWIVATLFYQFSQLIQTPLNSLIWIISLLLVLFFSYKISKRIEYFKKEVGNE